MIGCETRYCGAEGSYMFFEKNLVDYFYWLFCAEQPFAHSETLQAIFPVI